MHKIVEIDLISESIYEIDINNINNRLLIEELNNFNLLQLGKETRTTGFPPSGEETKNLQILIDYFMKKISGKEMFCKEFWMHSMDNIGGAIPRHNHKTNKQLHPEEYFSFAYYPSVPEDAANIHFVANYCNTIDTSITIKPENSKLLIFHSYVDHYTDRHSSTENRVCISGNYWPVDPDKTTVSDWSKYMTTKEQKKRVLKFS
jgi:hypothetical protein